MKHPAHILLAGILLLALVAAIPACDSTGASPDVAQDVEPSDDGEPPAGDDASGSDDEFTDAGDEAADENGGDLTEDGDPSPEDAGGDPEFDGGSDAELQDASDSSGPCGNWRESLSCCWLDAACHRALVVSHGGDWNVTDAPFLSRAAFEKAHEAGADGIEIDVSVTVDGVAVVAHSSPIEFYESLDCSGRKIEEMTAAEVTGCHLAPSLTQTFQRLDDVLAWAEGKLILELDVKRTEDLGQVIATLVALRATERAFLLVDHGEITGVIPQLADWERVRYLANIHDPSQVDELLALAASHNIFLFEMDRSYDGLDEQGVADIISSKINPGGVKAFCASDKTYVTVQVHLDMYRQGFDVVLSYQLANGVEAARQINLERGYPP